MKVNGLPVNFSISVRAIQAIEDMRRDWDSKFTDKAAVVSIAWGVVIEDRTGKTAGLPVVSFYSQSQLPEVARGIERISGIDVVFFITSADHWRFQNKLLDFDRKRGFLLS